MKKHHRGGKKYSIRSFYIEEDTLSKIKRISEKNNETLNATVNRMLKDMDMVMRVREYSHTLNIADHMLQFLLKNIDEQVYLIYAREKGGEIIREVLQRSGDQKNFVTFRTYLRDGYAKFSNWAEYSENVASDKVIICLSHKRGLIWSRFMKEYFIEQFVEFFGKDVVSDKNFSIIETGLVITLPLSEVAYEPELL